MATPCYYYLVLLPPLFKIDMMEEKLSEECPVCWRSFSSENVPTTIVCGHCFCDECSANLKRCPMCRKKLVPGYQRTTNYSLLSLIERIKQAGPRETKSQEVQTDYVLAPSSFRQRRVKSEPQTTEPVQTYSVNKQVVFRVGRDPRGEINRFEVRLK